ncbi:hypothetical protein PILCRDRAFT_823866 [Piloderma croceum F 1598]|uniref:Uncharacterized protein n=1 Tax=Piloderma croceum (strain F 1598) TaxID=765440 RepID=A0A0C3AYA9_PILCF|nr:hypothetical protein PILCRDRAFT_823866 [Piloderma croceum F 1598]
MHQLPPELCTEIFSLACRDSGFTGRSLSLVSRYVHETSKEAKLQSISIHGYDEIIAFAALLERTPLHLRSVRFCFISSQDRCMDETQAAWNGMQQLSVPDTSAAARNAYSREHRRLVDIWARSVDTDRKRDLARVEPKAIAFDSILKNIASTVEALEVDFDNRYDLKRHSLQTLTLPKITHLAIHGPSPLVPVGFTQQPILRPCPSLRRLHITIKASQKASVKPKCIFQHIPVLTPFLTHLRLSGFQDSEWIGASYLWAALGHPRKSWLEVDKLPETIETVLIQLQIPFSGTRDPSYDRLTRDCHELQNTDGRVCLLQPCDLTRDFSGRSPHRDYDLVENSNWLDWINGGEGCWDTSDRMQ